VFTVADLKIPLFPGLPGGRGEGELRRAAAGQGPVEEDVPWLSQGKTTVAAAATEATAAASGGSIGDEKVQREVQVKGGN
jgi:hypothetical protein